MTMDRPQYQERPWSFGALPPCPWEEARAVVLPAPMEVSVSYRGGTRLGPQAIIEASRNMELFDEELGVEPHLAGIVTLPEPELPDDPKAALDVLEAACAQTFSSGKLLAMLGGEHTVSLAGIRAASKRFKDAGGDFSVLQLDAHADLRDSYLGNPLSHACTMRRGLDHAQVVQAGIRSLSRDEADFMAERGMQPFWARDIAGREFAPRVLERLGERVYITVDLDVFDPAIMPAVGTPEPGGLGWYETLGLLSLVAREREVVGFDVVELAPIPGNPAPDFLAARLVYKLLAYVLKGPR